MKILRALCITLFASLSVVHAQSPHAGGDMGSMDLSFVKLFGENSAFAAQTSMQIIDKSGHALMTMNANMAVLDGKMRMDVDMANIQGPMFPPASLAQMKQLGMDKTVSIMRPDKKVAYVIYPGLKSYASLPITDAAIKSMNDKSNFKKTALGNETLDGHPCVKNKVTIPDEAGKVREFTLWNATDLKDFPIQFQTMDNGQTIVSSYKNIHFTRPDPRQFEPPTDYKSYPDMQAMQVAIMQKMSQQHSATNTP